VSLFRDCTWRVTGNTEASRGNADSELISSARSDYFWIAADEHARKRLAGECCIREPCRAFWKQASAIHII
jgi:hypothetical protein